MKKNDERKLVYVETDKLIPYANNAKVHGDIDVDAVMASIQRFGFTNPILTWNGIVVAGHGRLLAAKRLGLEKVPTIPLDYMTDEERRAYILADNRIAELSGWNFNVLDSELADISEIDMSLFGFDESAIDDLEQGEQNKQSMAEKYLVPPFSVIYANSPKWLERKRQWVNIGIRSELGRGGDLLTIQGAIQRQTSYQGGGREKQSVQEQQKVKQLHDKSKAYSDGRIERREEIRRKK